MLSGPPPDRARRVVLALHGRGAEAGGIVRRYTEIAGHDPETAVVGLRTVSGNRWYGVKYGEAGAGADAEVVAALDRVDAALAALAGHIPRDRTVLAGFSQGACLALEYAARRGAGLAAVIAPCGARIGLPSEWAAGSGFAGMPVLLGAGANDAWVDSERIDATAAWFQQAGATAEVLSNPGERHDISARQRLRARELIRGIQAPAGASGFGNTMSSEAIEGALPRPAEQPAPAAAAACTPSRSTGRRSPPRGPTTPAPGAIASALPRSAGRSRRWPTRASVPRSPAARPRST